MTYLRKNKVYRLDGNGFMEETELSECKRGDLIRMYLVDEYKYASNEDGLELMLLWEDPSLNEDTERYETKTLTFFGNVDAYNEHLTNNGGDKEAVIRYLEDYYDAAFPNWRE